MTIGVCPFAQQIVGVRSFSAGCRDRAGFCDHTAGGFMSTMRDPGFWNGAGVSTHFAVGRDGSIIQLVNIFDTAFAQGRLGPSVTWPPYAAMGGFNPNGYLISTEHEDYERVGSFAHAVPGSQWTTAQYEADLRLKRWCVEECARAGYDVLRFGINSLAGHHMFDNVNRAECPGRYWRDEYRTRLYADLTFTAAEDEGDEMYAIAEPQNRRPAGVTWQRWFVLRGNKLIHIPSPEVWVDLAAQLGEEAFIQVRPDTWDVLTAKTEMVGV